MTTNYTLDLAAGLTQVLDDGTNTYLYGNGRIAQAGNTTEYFLGDALGSVRQLADPAGVVTLTQSYAPYGEIVSSVGNGHSVYQYTGEIRDANGLTYLRARYYAPQKGQFTSRDIWAGNYNRPLSLNKWNYVEGNPISRIDPTGMQCQGHDCPPPPTFTPPPPTETPEPPIAQLYEDAYAAYTNAHTCSMPSPDGSYDVPCWPQQNNLNSLPMINGFVFGFAVSGGGYAGFDLVEGLWDKEYQCTFGTVGTGVEIVYDFRNQERSMFTFPITGNTLGTAVGAGAVLYTGVTRGGFQNGVRDYRGFFEGVGISVGPGSASVARPIRSDGTVDPDGVFALYFGVGVSIGKGLPVNISYQQSDYFPLEVGYQDYNGSGSYEHTIALRKAAANKMAAEITSAAVSTGQHSLLGRAIYDLRKWVYFR